MYFAQMRIMEWVLSTEKRKLEFATSLKLDCLKIFFSTTSLAFKVLGSLAGHIKKYIISRHECILNETPFYSLNVQPRPTGKRCIKETQSQYIRYLLQNISAIIP